MTKLTVNTADSAVVLQPVAPVKEANPVTLIDERNASVISKQGRVIKVKKLSAIDRMRLFRAVGAEDSENRAYMHYSVLAASVTELAGDPISFPTSAIQLQATVARLDEDGLDAVVSALIALSPELIEGVADAARNL